MRTEKKGLGRGFDTLIPAQTVTGKEAAKDGAKEAGMYYAARVVGDAMAGLDDNAAKRMLRMIIDYCRFNLENGYRG
jgi:hypothetical protein